jgi:hypothetical protein
MLFIFSTPVLIRHLWQLKTVVFLHWCLICTLLLCSAYVQSGNTKGGSITVPLTSCLTGLEISVYDNWQFLLSFAKQTNPNRSNRRSIVQWYFSLQYSMVQYLLNTFKIHSTCIQMKYLIFYWLLYFDQGKVPFVKQWLSCSHHFSRSG